MAGSLHRRVLLAAALVALVPSALAGGYGTDCSKSEDCTDSGAPFCEVYFKDYSYVLNNKVDETPGPQQNKGYCVECKVDCDCSPNQYCGVAPSDGEKLLFPVGLQSSNGGSGMSSYAQTKIAFYARSFGGMPLRSKCLDLAPTGGVCHRAGDMNLYTKMVTQYQNPQQLNGLSTAQDAVVVRVPTGSILKDSEQNYCAKVAQWIPEFRSHEGKVENPDATSEVAMRATDATLSTGNTANTPGACPKWVRNKEAAKCCNQWQCNGNENVGDDCQTGQQSITDATKNVCVKCQALCGYSPGIAAGHSNMLEKKCRTKCKSDSILGACGETDAILSDFKSGWEPACQTGTANTFQSKSPNTYDEAEFTISFISPAKEWEGSCYKGNCRVCVEEDKRCEDATFDMKGVHQTCRAGRWEATDDLKAYSYEYGNYSPETKAMVVVAFFCIIFTLALIAFAVVFCLCMKNTDEDDKKGGASAQVAYVASPAVAAGANQA
mmetsp:Transcript_54883/g.130305  ORF Transcript_54883/g.130305 Transcript_54883/m.130305 type:complete len:493 (-) Transcript_54883:183-1661(-)